MQKYLDTELMPLIPASDKGKKFATGVILSLAINKFDSLAASLGQKYMLTDLGIVTANGIDLETLKDVVLSNVPAEGLTLNIAMLRRNDYPQRRYKQALRHNQKVLTRR